MWACVLILVALVGCKTRSVDKERPPPEPVAAVLAEPVPAPVAPVPPVPTPAPVPVEPPTPEPGRRDVAPERGVPLDQAVLGPQPHPFGALEGLTPRATRDEVLALAPTAQRDDKDNLVVALGVEGLMASVVFDYSHHLDWVVVGLPSAVHWTLAKAWGKPVQAGDSLVWFDRTKRWRADLAVADEQLTIGRYVPIDEQFGKGPDGLLDSTPLIGRTLEEARQAFGDRISSTPTTDAWFGAPAEGETMWKLLLPATDVCKFFSNVRLVVNQGVVTRLELWQCVAGEASRGLSLRGFEKAWGKAVPARGDDDLPIFTFPLPKRLVELRWSERGWLGIIRPR